MQDPDYIRKLMLLGKWVIVLTTEKQGQDGLVNLNPNQNFVELIAVGPYCKVFDEKQTRRWRRKNHKGGDFGDTVFVLDGDANRQHYLNVIDSACRRVPYWIFSEDRLMPFIVDDGNQIKAMADYLILDMCQDEQKVKGGIAIPDAHVRTALRGKVVSAGPQVWDVQAGDIVRIPSLEYVRLELNEQRLVAIKEREVIAVEV